MARKIDLVLRGQNSGGDTMFLTPQLRKDWASHFDGENWIATFKLVSSMNEKQRMFQYLWGPLLDSALICFEQTGYEFANTADIYYFLKTKFGKYMWFNPVTGKEQPRLLDFSEDHVTADQLNKFINDCILWMEQEFQFVPPDAQAYRVQKKLGKGFTPMKGQKFTDL